MLRNMITVERKLENCEKTNKKDFLATDDHASWENYASQ